MSWGCRSNHQGSAPHTRGKAGCSAVAPVDDTPIESHRRPTATRTAAVAWAEQRTALLGDKDQKVRLRRS